MGETPLSGLGAPVTRLEDARLLTGRGRFIELQGTGERATFDDGDMRALIRLAKSGVARVTRYQRKLLAGSGLLPE